MITKSILSRPQIANDISRYRAIAFLRRSPYPRTSSANSAGAISLFEAVEKGVGFEVGLGKNAGF